MNPAEQRLADDRAVRNAARAVHQANVARVKADLGARSVPARVSAKAKHDALELAEEALDVARESKGIIAGGIGALLLWAFRGQVSALVQRLFKPATVQDAADKAPTDTEVEEHEA